MELATFVELFYKNALHISVCWENNQRFRFSRYNFSCILLDANNALLKAFPKWMSPSPPNVSCEETCKCQFGIKLCVFSFILFTAKCTVNFLCTKTKYGFRILSSAPKLAVTTISKATVCSLALYVTSDEMKKLFNLENSLRVL